ncbi:MAG: glycosyltransferase [Candidatus Jordarchaeaceae archaeon]
MKPMVTIGVCVRNCENTIKDAIESIIAQDYPHELMEAIFVDDGSEDDTLSIIERYATKMDMKVKVFSHAWKGLGSSRNVVIKNAKGDYIIWVDGDMILSKDFVRSQVDFMEKNQRIGIAKGRYGLLSNENLVYLLENIPYVVWTNKYAGNSVEKCVGTGGCVYRVKAIKEIGGFDEQLKGAGEDMDIEFRLRNAGWSICISFATFYEKRPSSWAALWRKYYWYGYGLYESFGKNRYAEKLCFMSLPSAFISGLLFSFDAYRFTRIKKIFLMLPIHFTYKMSAWWIGFIKNLSSTIKLRFVTREVKQEKNTHKQLKSKHVKNG